MKHIYILGCNGTARDILEAIGQIRSQTENFPEVGGFLDDRVARGTRFNGVPVAGPVRLASKLRDAFFINAIGSPESYRLKPVILEKIGLPPEAFITVIHPQAVISPTARLGRGCAVLAGVSIGSGVRLGNHVVILQNSVVSHDSRIGHYVSMATGVCLSGNVIVRENAYLGSQVSIRGGLTIGRQSLVGDRDRWW